MKFVIQGRLPGMNEIIALSKKHPTEYSKVKKQYTEQVAWEAKAQNLRPFKRANFIITWYCVDKRRNKDNIMAGTKFILDGLQMAGIIKNDGWSEIGVIMHVVEVDAKNPRIEINFTPFAGDDSLWTW